MNSKNTSASNKSDDYRSRNDPSTSKKLWPTNEPTAERKCDKKRHITLERNLNGVKFQKQEEGASLRYNEGKAVQPTQQCQQPGQMHSTTSCLTNGTSDYDAVDPNKNNCVLPQNNMYGTMNQWGAPVNSGSPGMGMASSNPSGSSLPEMVPPDPMPDFCLMPIPNDNATKDYAFQTLSPIVNYSECEAVIVVEQLQNEETFKQASRVLIHWLEVGECNQRNASTFYFMIRSMYCHIKKLIARKTKINYELQADKNNLSQKCILNGVPFNDIENVFKHALMQKVWGHFAKAQQKCIGTWKNNILEFKNANIGDLLRFQMEVEMELCDEEDKKPCENLEKSQKKEELSKLSAEKAKLQVENEILRCLFRVATNELALRKAEENEKEAAFEDACVRMHERLLLTRRELEEAKEDILDMICQENVSSEGE